MDNEFNLLLLESEETAANSKLPDMEKVEEDIYLEEISCTDEIEESEDDLQSYSSWEDMNSSDECCGDELNDTSSSEEESHEGESCPYRHALSQVIDHLREVQRKHEQAEIKLNLLSETLQDRVQKDLDNLQQGILKMAFTLKQEQEETQQEIRNKLKDKDDHNGLLETRIMSLQKRLVTTKTQLEEQKTLTFYLKKDIIRIKEDYRRHLAACELSKPSTMNSSS